MKISMLRYVFGLLLFSGCMGLNEKVVEGDIVLKIVNEKLYLKEDTINLEVEIVNNTDSTFLLFAFGMTHEGIFEESFFEEPDIASGTGLFIYDEEGNTLEQHEPELGPTSFDDVYSLKEESSKIYVDRMLKLQSDTTVQLSLSFKLRYFRPKPGRYNAHLVHYSGSNVYVFVPAEKVKELEQQYDAHVFQGWIKSNTVKLMVE